MTKKKFFSVKLTLNIPCQSNMASYVFKNILKYIFKRSMKKFTSINKKVILRLKFSLKLFHKLYKIILLRYLL